MGVSTMKYIVLAVYGLIYVTMAATFPGPEPLKGVIPSHGEGDFVLDPTVIRRASDAKLFLYTTGQTGQNHWTADSLYGPWTLGNGTAIDGEGGLGAPQAFLINQTYYMLYHKGFNYSSVGIHNNESESKNHNQAVYVATSSTLEPGSWKPISRYNITWSERYNILGSSLLTIPNGSKSETFLSFGSYYHGLFQVPLADPPVQLAPDAMAEMTHLAENTTTPGLNPIEGAFLFKYDNYYYMTFSSGNYGPDSTPWPYMIMICRSTNPRDGFVDRNGKSCKDGGATELLGSNDAAFAPGSAGFMFDKEADGPIIYYCYVAVENGVKQPGHRFGWNKLQFGSDGWPTVVAPQ